MKYEHEGHRQRMYEKLRETGLLDWEILEILLYSFQPRKNTCDAAHKLVEKFGSAVGVFFASVEQLLSVEGIGESIANNLYSWGVLFRENFKIVYDPFAGEFHLEEFLLRGGDMYKGEKNEVLDVYLLDENNRVISRHRRTDKQAERVDLDTKWLGKLLADPDVYGVVIVHNHPNGAALYSTADERSTRACQMLCTACGKVLCDHVIFSPDGAYSYYQKGRLEKISKEYAFEKVVRERSQEEFMENAVALRLEAEALKGRKHEK